jgi:hypothetical protein
VKGGLGHDAPKAPLRGALLSVLTGAQWYSKGAAVSNTGAFTSHKPKSPEQQTCQLSVQPTPAVSCRVVATVAISQIRRREKMLGKKKSKAEQGKRMMPGMVVKERATAKGRKAPAHPSRRVGFAASCRQERLDLVVWLEPAGAGSGSTQAKAMPCHAMPCSAASK